MLRNEPVIGQWYQDEQARIFEVVAIDDEAVEIQYQDGDVAEIELELWFQTLPEPVAEQNAAAGPFDELEGFDSAMEPDLSADWQSHIDEI